MRVRAASHSRKGQEIRHTNTSSSAVGGHWGAWLTLRPSLRSQLSLQAACPGCRCRRAMTCGMPTGSVSVARPRRSVAEPGWMTTMKLLCICCKQAQGAGPQWVPEPSPGPGPGPVTPAPRPARTHLLQGLGHGGGDDGPLGTALLALALALLVLAVFRLALLRLGHGSSPEEAERRPAQPRSERGAGAGGPAAGTAPQGGTARGLGLPGSVLVREGRLCRCGGRKQPSPSDRRDCPRLVAGRGAPSGGTWGGESVGGSCCHAA